MNSLGVINFWVVFLHYFGRFAFVCWYLICFVYLISVTKLFVYICRLVVLERLYCVRVKAVVPYLISSRINNEFNNHYETETYHVHTVVICRDCDYWNSQRPTCTCIQVPSSVWTRCVDVNIGMTWNDIRLCCM